MNASFWRQNGAYLLILGIGAAGIIGAAASGVEGASEAALGATIVATVGWAAFDYFRGSPGDEPDAFERSLGEAREHERAAKAALKSRLIWTSATRENCPAAMSARLETAIGLFPEFIALADGRIWLAGERDWWGWPDPPRFFLVGFDEGGDLAAATDFGNWPKCWNRPAGLARQ